MLRFRPHPLHPGISILTEFAFCVGHTVRTNKSHCVCTRTLTPSPPFISVVESVAGGRENPRHPVRFAVVCFAANVTHKMGGLRRVRWGRAGETRKAKIRCFAANEEKKRRTTFVADGEERKLKANDTRGVKRQHNPSGLCAQFPRHPSPFIKYVAPCRVRSVTFLLLSPLDRV